MTGCRRAFPVVPNLEPDHELVACEIHGELTRVPPTGSEDHTQGELVVACWSMHVGQVSARVATVEALRVKLEARKQPSVAMEVSAHGIRLERDAGASLDDARRLHG